MTDTSNFKKRAVSDISDRIEFDCVVNQNKNSSNVKFKKKYQKVHPIYLSPILSNKVVHRLSINGQRVMKRMIPVVLRTTVEEIQKRKRTEKQLTTTTSI